MREEFFEQIKVEIESWYKSQVDQTDSYEYERSFSEMMQRLGQKILQESVGEVPKSRNGKKISNQCHSRTFLAGIHYPKPIVKCRIF